jgi:hypothetical protein
MSESPLLPKRKRGGQPGNANAFKHGLHSPAFQSSLARSGRLIPYPAYPEHLAVLWVYMDNELERALESGDGVEADQIFRRVGKAFRILKYLVRLGHAIRVGQAFLDPLLLARLDYVTAIYKKACKPPDPPPSTSPDAGGPK